MPKQQRRENWKQVAQNMRQESRQVEAPTYQLGYGQMPELPDRSPHNPNNRAQLRQKLDYQQALKARQAWLNLGNRPGQNYPDLPANTVPQGSMDPNTTAAPGQPYTPPAGGVSPTIPYRGQNRHRGGGGQGGYGGGYGGYPTVGLPQPQPGRHPGRKGQYPKLTY